MAKILSDKAYQKAHHTYVYDVKKVDAKVCVEHAMARAFDKRDPGATVIHHHSYEEVEKCLMEGYVGKIGECPLDSKYEHEEFQVSIGRVWPVPTS